MWSDLFSSDSQNDGDADGSQYKKLRYGYFKPRRGVVITGVDVQGSDSDSDNSSDEDFLNDSKDKVVERTLEEDPDMAVVIMQVCVELNCILYVVLYYTNCILYVVLYYTIFI